MKAGPRLSRRAFIAGGLGAVTRAGFGSSAPTRPYRYSGATLEAPTVCWLGINGLEAALNTRAHYLCGDVFAFLFDIDGLRLLNIGSSNLDPSAIKGTACDLFFCGVSNYFDRPGFPQLVHDKIVFKTFIPTHHDAFARYELVSYETEDVSAFMKGDFIRFKEELRRIAPYGDERFRELAPLRTVPLG